MNDSKVRDMKYGLLRPSLIAQSSQKQTSSVSIDISYTDRKQCATKYAQQPETINGALNE